MIIIIIILWDSDIHTNHIISAGRPDLMIVNIKNRTCDIGDHRVKLKEVEKRDKYLDSAREEGTEINYRAWKWRWYQL